MAPCLSTMVAPSEDAVYQTHCLWPLNHQVRPLKVLGWGDGRGDQQNESA